MSIGQDKKNGPSPFPWEESYDDMSPSLVEETKPQEKDLLEQHAMLGRSAPFILDRPKLSKALFLLALAIFAGVVLAATKLSLGSPAAITAGIALPFIVAIAGLIYSLGQLCVGWLKRKKTEFGDAQSPGKKAFIAIQVLLSFLVLTASIAVPIAFQLLGFYPVFSELLWPGIISATDTLKLTTGGTITSLEGIIIAASVGLVIGIISLIGEWVFQTKPPGQKISSEDLSDDSDSDEQSRQSNCLDCLLSLFPCARRPTAQRSRNSSDDSQHHLIREGSSSGDDSQMNSDSGTQTPPAGGFGLGGL
jgi:hypothetical protein